MRRTPNQIVGAAFGAVYVLVGLAGFAITSGIDFAARDGENLLGIFEVNPLHNLVHLAIGAALLFGALSGVVAARAINAVVGASYLLVGLAGLVLIDKSANVLAVNGADNVLHLASAALLLGVAIFGAAAERTVDTGAAARRSTGAGHR